MAHLKKVLLTGGAGYIGSHTAVELIQQGFDVVVLDDFSRSEKRMVDGIEKITGKNVVCYQGSCTDEKFLDTVFSKENFLYPAVVKSIFRADSYLDLPLIP